MKALRKHIPTALLFAASAAVTVWQNARLTVLWDASYILENASRIAAGDVPYRDFPFPYAPLTFAAQAAIIALFGRVWWHHVAWAALACGTATALTYAIARRLVSAPTAFILTAPLALLGIYCIFPHPFYDPDACLVVLAIVAALLAGRNEWAVGAAAVLPLFVKQNIGLAFVVSLAVLCVIARRWRIIGGMAGGAAAAAAIVAAVFGLGNYWRWTIEFAAQRRLPPLAQQLAIFNDPTLWCWLAAVAAGVLLMRRVRWLGALLMIAPWLYTIVNVYVTDDPVEPQIDLLRFWPLMIVCGAGVALASARAASRGPGAGADYGPRSAAGGPLLPLLVVATILGTFLSQSTWGSTYGIWPLLIILIVLLFRATRAPRAAAIVVALVMLHSAWPYVRDNERLTYAKWSEGAPHRSSLPALRGMTMRGDWLPDFEELVAFTDAHIPRNDAILCLPGEDLFYFATGRRPRVPVLMFDRTVNPYDADEIAAFARQRGVRWIIVKRRLQLNGEPFPELAKVLAILRPRPVAALRNYAIYALR